jgi:hypothetical protein
MKKIMLAAVISATVALSACDSGASEEETPADAAVLDDDHDAPEPVVVEHPDDHEHEEGTDPNHAH